MSPFWEMVVLLGQVKIVTTLCSHTMEERRKIRFVSFPREDQLTHTTSHDEDAIRSMEIDRNDGLNRRLA